MGIRRLESSFYGFDCLNLVSDVKDAVQIDLQVLKSSPRSLNGGTKEQFSESSF